MTNIDFSKGVIKEMMLKNLRQRPLMKWQVMDMTQTKASPSASHIQEISDGPRVLSLPVALPAQVPAILVDKERANVWLPGHRAGSCGTPMTFDGAALCC